MRTGHVEPGVVRHPKIDAVLQDLGQRQCAITVPIVRTGELPTRQGWDELVTCMVLPSDSHRLSISTNIGFPVASCARKSWLQWVNICLRRETLLPAPEQEGHEVPPAVAQVHADAVLRHVVAEQRRGIVHCGTCACGYKS